MDDRQKRAKEAMMRRSREKVAKQGQDMNQYYAVIAFFIATMVAALLYTLLNPQQSFAQMPVIDESAMLVHNGQGHRFTQGQNEFFKEWTISDAKKLFETGLSDAQNLEPCKSAQNADLIIPESFDWRVENPTCSHETPRQVSTDCTGSSYIHSTLSAAEDRICKLGKKEPVRLSSQELVDCDKNSSCQRGTVNKVLTWGKRKGFVPETCFPETGEAQECPEEYLTDNECRAANNFYKVVDFCFAQDIDNIKKEILTNGPVLGQINPFTDMLTYSGGIYSRTNEAFKFQGNHIFKVLGWETTPENGSYWIVENSWGADWGENGYARIASAGETTLDFYAVSFAMYPKTMAEYYEEQQMREQQVEINPFEGMDLDNDVENIFLDEEEEEQMVDQGTVYEEGIDEEL